MASTPFFLGIILFLAWLIGNIHLVKVLYVLKGSSIVLRPDEPETPITSIKLKHGEDLDAEWFGGNPVFYLSCNDSCSLNTKTGELTINDVRLEHGGVYTPEINGKTLPGIKLQIFSPVLKPNTTHDCNPEETHTCILTCRLHRGDTEQQITVETKEKTFTCNMENVVCSENSTKPQNPLLLSGACVWIPAVLSAVLIVTLPAFVVFLCRLWIVRRTRRARVLRPLLKRNEKKSSEGDGQTLLDVDRRILSILKERNEINLSEECELMLLTVRSMISRILKEGTMVKKSLQNVQEMIETFFTGRNETKQNEDAEQALREVYQMISSIISKRKNKTAVPEEELSPLNEEIKLTLVKTSQTTAEIESKTGPGTDDEFEDPSTDPPEEGTNDIGEDL